MTKKIYHLSSCTTCQRILQQIPHLDSYTLQDIKTEKMTPSQVDEMRALSGSFEALFSRRAMKYRSMGLNEMDLNEDDYRRYILEEYTFLKRPVILIGEEMFVGNSKKVVEAMLAAAQR